MARKTTPEAYRGLLAAARKAIPDVAITTDIIVGFPGETENEFMESLRFVEEMSFSRGHVFTYSERPGTAAARMPSSVPYPVRKSRNSRMREVLSQAQQSYQNRFIGRRLPVLWESAEPGNAGWVLHGISDNYLRVSATHPEQCWNQYQLVEIISANGMGLNGTIIGTRDNVAQTLTE
jgi:threonylcarbamoyladenosine tRNA methylthiotransferase MtaB